MHKRYLVAGILAVILATCGGVVFAGPGQNPASPYSQQIVVKEVQLRDSISAYDEYVIIANNTHAPFDVTGWCANYINSSQTSKTLDCFTPTPTITDYTLPVNGIAVLASTQEMATLPPNTPVDGIFAGTLSNDTGAIQLTDANGKLGDKVDWGSDASYGTNETIPVGDVITRLPAEDTNYVLKDTNSLEDFVLAPITAFPSSSLTPIYDLCLNLAGVQTEIPPGDSVDGQGNCSLAVDVCLNIDGYQAELPPGLTLDDAGNCLQDETTPPDDGNDDTPPPSDGSGDSDGSSNSDDTSPPDNPPPAVMTVPYVTELLPNPSGDDKGAEFIEIYNPNDTAIDLSTYKLRIGAMLDTTIVVPSGTMIAAKSYLALYNSVVNFTLVNSSGAASVIGGTASDVYGTAPDGEAWALINGTWQWTNQPTPGAENATSIAPSIDALGDTSVSASRITTLKPCAANQYRSPETNRCRLIATTESGSTLTPCAADEERNPDTNRCRKIGASSNTPAPCKANQERNPATNRCKNIVAMPSSTDYKVLGAKAIKDSHMYIWWIVGGVAAVGVGYAVWEWHEEISRGAKWAWARAKQGVRK